MVKEIFKPPGTEPKIFRLSDHRKDSKGAYYVRPYETYLTTRIILLYYSNLHTVRDMNQPRVCSKRNINIINEWTF